MFGFTSTALSVKKDNPQPVRASHFVFLSSSPQLFCFSGDIMEGNLTSLVEEQEGLEIARKQELEIQEAKETVEELKKCLTLIHSFYSSNIQYVNVRTIMTIIDVV